MNELVSIGKLDRRILRIKRKLSQLYRRICLAGTDDVTSDPDTARSLDFFADNYYTVSDACDFLLGYDKKQYVSKDLRISRLADDFSDRIPSAEEMITLLSRMDDGVIPLDIENLKYILTYGLVNKTCEAVLKGEDASRYITLLADMGSLDVERINEAVNAVSGVLAGSNAYSQSDKDTKRLYRLKIYTIAAKEGKDPEKLALSLMEKSKERGVSLESLINLAPKRKAQAPAVLYFAAVAAFSLVLSFAIGALVKEIWTGVFLVIPIMTAVRALTDGVLLRFSKPRPLLRLDPCGEKVKSTPCAIVLSCALSGAESTDKLYDRLTKLYASNPQENMRYVALCDLSPEQMPITGDDKVSSEGLREVIERLNNDHCNRFYGIIRKRSYSKTQDEYMGKERKRGAIIELCRYMATGRSDFYSFVGDKKLVGTNYICAVDFDTEPYMDAVSDLMSIALHPANLPVIEGKRVKSGFGIISPAMVTRLDSSLSTGFSRGMGGIGSLSSYDAESHDFWQDAFGSGSFCGKGLINAEALLKCASMLPEERILSHDILEGELCSCAYAGSVVFTEGFPSGAVSYFKRLDRWIRGDVQNLVFLFSKDFDGVSKIKLVDNIIRALLSPAVLAALYLGVILYPEASAPVAAAALIAYLFPDILGLLRTVLTHGMTARRFYSGLLNETAHIALRAFYKLVLLPTVAVKSAKAVLVALFRMITRRRLLEWTTSAAADSIVYDPVMYFFIPEVAGALLFLSQSPLIRLLALLFTLMPFVLLVGSKTLHSKEARPGCRDTRELSSQIADMWGFFDRFVTEADNFLPPDNVQFSPVYRVCHRTSPTNIGMYMLSVLAACDRRIISVSEMCRRLTRTLNSLERMEKYRGNLYNWYDTTTLKPCPNPYVSSVDSGNFVVSLVTLREGIKEYIPRCAPLSGLVPRMEKLISETDLGAFYNGVKGLMSIGIYPETGKLDRSCYDCLMSEARLTSFYAIASRQVPKSHWRRLSRTALSRGFYSGCASYSGTMFEYFMPEIFIKSPESSVMYESLKYAIGCQKSYANSCLRPYGISESGYYSFDSMLNYRYMAHGVPGTGLKRGLDADYVVSPYSTYLSLDYSPKSGVENLRRLKSLGMYSRFGFYEALDFGSKDHQDEPQIVRSYMSHHVGMSILSAVNYLHDGIFRKRFMSDKNVLGASELLSERVELSRSVCENILIRPKKKAFEPIKSDTESFDDISPFSPRAKMLCSREYTLVMTDGGLATAIYRGKNVYSRTRDMVMRPKGAFFGIGDGVITKSFTLFPDAQKKKDSVCEFGDDHVTYYCSTDRVNAGMRVTLHSGLACEIRTFAVENTDRMSVPLSLYAYIEPSLSPDSAEEAHPAFDKLFIELDYDSDLNLVIASRSDGVQLAVGFVEDVEYSVSLDREEVLSRPEGVTGLFDRAEDIGASYVSRPDPCIFIKSGFELPAGTKTEINLFILACDDRSQLVNSVSELRQHFDRIKPLSYDQGTGARLADHLLPYILYLPEKSEKRMSAIIENDLPINALWELSVSTDIPLLLLELNGKNDEDKLLAYLKAVRLLTTGGIRVQLAVLFDDEGSYRREHYTMLVSYTKELGLDGLIYSSGGILPVDTHEVRKELITLLRAYACHISKDFIISEHVSSDIRNIIDILPVRGQPQKIDDPVALGGFKGESYVINEKPPLPWCHVLSSRQFGTLLSDMSLGFTYAFNSRELRLTPWDNDTSRDNMGERLILRVGGRYFDLVKGAAAVFSPYKAEYFFEEDDFSGSVTVTVSQKGMCKKVELNLNSEKDCEVAYYCEPCLGFNRKNSSLMLSKEYNGALVVSSHASSLNGFMALRSDRKSRFIVSRREFLGGNFGETLEPDSDGCAASVVSLSEGRSLTNFYLSYALDMKAAADMPNYFCSQTDTRENIITDKCHADKDRNILASCWLRYQALHARIWARTGFYQCSGAYGFRDQLQDACGIVKENPSVLKSLILRASSAQFPEGDVMHWWHSLPLSKTRGIRTMITDDNLWLPYAVCEYIKATGDESILELKVRYCQGIVIAEGQKECYGEVYPTSLKESVYDHCKRAIDYRIGKTGDKGIMLMGTGDWNDGFNSLGEGGKGQSVWLSEFFCLVLRRFYHVAVKKDAEYAGSLLKYADELENAVTEKGRDPQWYRRAYTDSGEIIGSCSSDVCRIDSIAQSFAVFADFKDKRFNRGALISAYNELADIKCGTVKLFDPPVPHDYAPRLGYIQDYPQGMRENGGQYTHAAVWLGMALRRAGLNDEAETVLDIINPIKRSRDGGYKRYKTEPYYLSGDVYTNENCPGRGGWSIYTGSAGWYYKALSELDDE